MLIIEQFEYSEISSIIASFSVMTLPLSYSMYAQMPALIFHFKNRHYAKGHVDVVSRRCFVLVIFTPMALLSVNITGLVFCCCFRSLSCIPMALSDKQLALHSLRGFFNHNVPLNIVGPII